MSASQTVRVIAQQLLNSHLERCLVYFRRDDESRNSLSVVEGD